MACRFHFPTKRRENNVTQTAERKSTFYLFEFGQSGSGAFNWPLIKLLNKYQRGYTTGRGFQGNSCFLSWLWVCLLHPNWNWLAVNSALTTSQHWLVELWLQAAKRPITKSTYITISLRMCLSSAKEDSTQFWETKLVSKLCIVTITPRPIVSYRHLHGSPLVLLVRTLNHKVHIFKGFKPPFSYLFNLLVIWFTLLGAFEYESKALVYTPYVKYTVNKSMCMYAEWKG